MSCTKSLPPRFSSRPEVYKACSAWKFKFSMNQFGNFWCYWTAWIFSETISFLPPINCTNCTFSISLFKDEVSSKNFKHFFLFFDFSFSMKSPLPSGCTMRFLWINPFVSNKLQFAFFLNVANNLEKVWKFWLFTKKSNAYGLWHSKWSLELGFFYV